MIKTGHLNRRQFVRRLAKGVMIPGLLAGGMAGGYALHEAKRCGVICTELGPRNLPAAFNGMTIAFLADTHHGQMNPLDYLEHVVEMTNALQPDLILLGGDYVEHHHSYTQRGSQRRYVVPGVAVLSKLRAPMGRYAVLGNHDYLVDPALTRRALAEHGLTEITNTGVWLERGGARLRLCGVDDWGRGRPMILPALGDMTAADAAIIVTHNPDFVEYVRDPRADLFLSGHTHGGQVVLPIIGAPVTASKFGQKYVQGLRRAPHARVFVTRGVGTTGMPIRFACPPEVVLITLRTPAAV